MTLPHSKSHFGMSAGLPLGLLNKVRIWWSGFLEVQHNLDIQHQKGIQHQDEVKHHQW